VALERLAHGPDLAGLAEQEGQHPAFEGIAEPVQRLGLGGLAVAAERVELGLEVVCRPGVDVGPDLGEDLVGLFRPAGVEQLQLTAGVVTGRARVLLRAGTDQLEPGEILVAPFTDPGWTPYFINAAAIVMDLGGLLSHGSIVAREFGIPAVVNVGPATEVIETGQMLRVDGGKGRVEILGD